MRENLCLCMYLLFYICEGTDFVDLILIEKWITVLDEKRFEIIMHLLMTQSDRPEGSLCD